MKMDLDTIVGCTLSMSEENRVKFLAKLHPDDQIAVTARLKWLLTARAEQLPPHGNWVRWITVAGRGAGKTRLAAEWTWWESWKAPGTYHHVIAPTWDSDVVGVAFMGPSGLLSVCPPELIEEWNKGDAILKLKNGSIIRGFSGEKPDRLRGPQCSRIWADEAAAWQYLTETWDMAMFGARLGDDIRIVVTTTPQPKPLIVQWIREGQKPEKTRTYITRGSTYDNKANLAKQFFDDLVKKYEGTNLGRQELLGEVIDPEEQGIVKKSWIKLWPADRRLPPFRWIVLSLDTAYTEKTRDKKTGETDPTAATVWGLFDHPDQPGRDCVMLLDCWQEWLGLPKLLKKVQEELNIRYGDQHDPVIKSPTEQYFGRPALAIAGGRKPDICLIEEKGSGISLRQTLAAEGIEAFAYNPGKASKVERLHGVSHLFHNGVVWMVESKARPGEPVSWADHSEGNAAGLVTQLCTFSGEGSIKHDDYVDSCTQAITYLTRYFRVTSKPRELVDAAVEAYRPARRRSYKG